MANFRFGINHGIVYLVDIAYKNVYTMDYYLNPPKSDESYAIWKCVDKGCTSTLITKLGYCRIERVVSGGHLHKHRSKLPKGMKLIPKLACSPCNTQFKAKEDLIQHVLFAHEGEELLVCDYCESFFDDDKTYVKHMAVHKKLISNQKKQHETFSQDAQTILNGSQFNENEARKLVQDDEVDMENVDPIGISEVPEPIVVNSTKKVPKLTEKAQKQLTRAEEIKKYIEGLKRNRNQTLTQAQRNQLNQEFERNIQVPNGQSLLKNNQNPLQTTQDPNATQVEQNQAPNGNVQVTLMEPQNEEPVIINEVYSMDVPVVKGILPQNLPNLNVPVVPSAPITNFVPMGQTIFYPQYAPNAQMQPSNHPTEKIVYATKSNPGSISKAGNNVVYDAGNNVVYATKSTPNAGPRQVLNPQYSNNVIVTKTSNNSGSNAENVLVTNTSDNVAIATNSYSDTGVTVLPLGTKLTPLYNNQENFSTLSGNKPKQLIKLYPLDKAPNSTNLVTIEPVDENHSCGQNCSEKHVQEPVVQEIVTLLSPEKHVEIQSNGIFTGKPMVIEPVQPSFNSETSRFETTRLATKVRTKINQDLTSLNLVETFVPASFFEKNGIPIHKAQNNNQKSIGYMVKSPTKIAVNAPTKGGITVKLNSPKSVLKEKGDESGLPSQSYILPAKSKDSELKIPFQAKIALEQEDEADSKVTFLSIEKGQNNNQKSILTEKEKTIWQKVAGHNKIACQVNPKDDKASKKEEPKKINIVDLTEEEKVTKVIGYPHLKLVKKVDENGKVKYDLPEKGVEIKVTDQKIDENQVKVTLKPVHYSQKEPEKGTLGPPLRLLSSVSRKTENGIVKTFEYEAENSENLISTPAIFDENNPTPVELVPSKKISAQEKNYPVPKNQVDPEIKDFQSEKKTEEKEDESKKETPKKETPKKKEEKTLDYFRAVGKMKNRPMRMSPPKPKKSIEAQMIEEIVEKSEKEKSKTKEMREREAEEKEEKELEELHKDLENLGKEVSKKVCLKYQSPTKSEDEEARETMDLFLEDSPERGCQGFESQNSISLAKRSIFARDSPEKSSSKKTEEPKNRSLHSFLKSPEKSSEKNKVEEPKKPFRIPKKAAILSQNAAKTYEKGTNDLPISSEKWPKSLGRKQSFSLRKSPSTKVRQIPRKLLSPSKLTEKDVEIAVSTVFQPPKTSSSRRKQSLSPQKSPLKIKKSPKNQKKSVSLKLSLADIKELKKNLKPLKKPKGQKTSGASKYSSGFSGESKEDPYELKLSDDEEDVTCTLTFGSKIKLRSMDKSSKVQDSVKELEEPSAPAIKMNEMKKPKINLRSSVSSPRKNLRSSAKHSMSTPKKTSPAKKSKVESFAQKNMNLLENIPPIDTE